MPRPKYEDMEEFWDGYTIINRPKIEVWNSKGQLHQDWSIDLTNHIYKPCPSCLKPAIYLDRRLRYQKLKCYECHNWVEARITNKKLDVWLLDGNTGRRLEYDNKLGFVRKI